MGDWQISRVRLEADSRAARLIENSRVLIVKKKKDSSLCNSIVAGKSGSVTGLQFVTEQVKQSAEPWQGLSKASESATNSLR